jgi:hypothetical protein
MAAWWPLDETSGSTTADLAGFPNDGTHLNTPTPTPGTVDGALCFNGTDEYVEVADDPEIDFDTRDFSIDGWLRTTDAGGVDLILDKRVETPPGAFWGFDVYVFNGNLGMQLADSTFTNYNSTAFVADGSWHHIAVTVDRDNPSGIVFYRDGTLVSSADPTSHPGSLTNTNPLRMACWSLGLANFFNGCLDEIELFQRVLTQPEIQVIYNAGSLGECRQVCPYKTGDFNGNNTITSSDIIALVNYVFKGAAQPDPKCRGDANGNGTITSSDIINLVNYVFKGGAAPIPSDVCCL